MIASLMLALLAVAGANGAGNYFEIDDQVLKKSGSDNYVNVSGEILYPNVNMTLTYPDGTTSHSASIIPKNTFSSFIYIDDDTFQSGLYRIDVVPYNSTEAGKQITDYFVLLDYDGTVNIRIEPNASVECAPTTDAHGNPLRIEEHCIIPAVSHIPLSFGVKFTNADYKTHNLQFGGHETGPIIPEGEQAIFFEKKSLKVFNYYCSYHPWVKGELRVSDVDSLRYVAPPPLIIPNATDHDPTNPGVSGLDAADYDLDGCEKCHVGAVTEIEDGDTIFVNGKPLRLALANAPEKHEDGFNEANTFVAKTCPVGMSVLVDIDDERPTDSYGKAIAKITCGKTNLNAALLEKGHAVPYSAFCSASEFLDEQWGADACGVELHVEQAEEFGPEQEDVIVIIPPIQDFQNNTSEIIDSIQDVEIDYGLVALGIMIPMAVAVLWLLSKRNGRPDYQADEEPGDNFKYLE